MTSVLILRESPKPEQVGDLLSVFETFIKLAVDIQRGVLAAGGEMHYDCEQALLEDGSQQADVWGADWIPEDRSVRFESLINIRPKQANFGLEIQSTECRAAVEQVIRRIFEEK